MRISRGIKDILFKNIDPLYKSDDSINRTYGNGTSYSSEKELSLEYCRTCKVFAWHLTYEFKEKNPLYISEANYVDFETFHENQEMFVNGNVIASNKLSEISRDLGHDCIIFEDGHVLLLEADELELVKIEFYTEDKEILKELKSLDFKNKESLFKISEKSANIPDNILKDLK